ncbi:hypothetical protein [Rhodohalobacter sp. 8-1]|uniref:hypothetical protein n=1 Tax=Rhodohalobacter sp. 8-1 TaxID=3131972 RepID=UPI0030EED1D6
MRFSAAAIGKILLVLICSLTANFWSFSNTANAQQMVVDDATVLVDRQMQIEAWYGTEQSWIQPSISLSHLWDITPGIIFNTGDDGSISQLFGELKYVPTDLSFDGYSYGWTGAIFFDTDGRVDRVYTYLPFTKYVLDRTSLVHLNIGFDGRDNIDGDLEYGFFTGLRADFGLTDRFSILSEVFTTDFESPSFQAGVRFDVVQDVLNIDITYGDSFKSEVDYPGLNIGIAFKPTRVW